MAESVTETITEAVTKIYENITTSAQQNATSKIPATTEGTIVAYTSLVLMAVFPIFFGAFRSIDHQKQQKESGEAPDTMSRKDAAMFPLVASCALFGLYIFFKILSKEYVNMLLTSYFFFLGILAFTHMLSPVLRALAPASTPNKKYHIDFGPVEEEKLIDYTFDMFDVAAFIVSALIGVWYLYDKHWMANNLFGLAFSLNGVELLSLNKVGTGCILLGGLFVYDIFWVFFTNVMVTVAKSFEAPIKLVFPRDFLEKGFYATNHAMLGLGDIVIPGIFIALLLRFDNSLKRGSNVYFNVTMLAYFLGLMTTIVVMHVFKHPQPALLYLVPACVIAPVLTGLIKGDIQAMFQYEDHPEENEGEKKEGDKKEGEKKEAKKEK